MSTTRRRFLKTVAATAAVAVVTPAGALAATAKAAAPADPVATEIARQKQGVATLVLRLREEKLVNAVEPALVFRPLRARRKGN